jgi:hypothetical protein
MLYFVLGCVLTVIVGAHYATRRSLSFVLRERTVLNDQSQVHPELEITFAGHKIQSLTQIDIGVWNSGNTTINENEVENPVGWLFAGRRLLKIGATETRHDGTEATASIEKGGGVQANFNYLNKNDWIYVRVYAVPIGEEALTHSVVGDIRGVSELQDVSTNEIPTRGTYKDLVFILPATVLIASFGLAATILSGSRLGFWGVLSVLRDWNDVIDPLYPTAGLAVGAFMFLLGLFGFLANLTRMAGVSIPSALRMKLSS